jgi:hypothetical protein
MEVDDPHTILAHCTHTHTHIPHDPTPYIIQLIQNPQMRVCGAATPVSWAPPRGLALWRRGARGSRGLLAAAQGHLQE